MTRTQDPRPSFFAILVAVALSVALSATVLAGADGQRSVTKGQAKKIAKKVVRKKAPKLSVRNAANLDGQPGSLYLDRVAQATSEEVVDVPGTNALEVLGPVNIDVPAGVNHVRIDGGGAFEPDGAFEGTVALWFQLDGTCAKTGFGYENPAYGNTEVGLQQISFHLVTDVTPGSHSFRLCASANNPSTVRARTLLVETVARGPNG